MWDRKVEQGKWKWERMGGNGETESWNGKINVGKESERVKGKWKSERGNKKLKRESVKMRVEKKNESWKGKVKVRKEKIVGKESESVKEKVVNWK